jgi:hypothetical protein
MAIQSSFPKVADQIINFNKNVVDILAKIDTAVRTTEPSIQVQVFDDEGILRNYSIPSFTNLKSEIERLNNNINSLYSIDTVGALIETSNQNRFKKIITVDLNREPNAVDTLGSVTTFKTSPNWFFDALLDPMLSVEIDLSGKIQNNVRKCLVRRYIVEFAKDVDGNLTNLGQSALNSFNQLWRGSSEIIVTEFENWHRTTPGVIEPLNPKFDEQIFDLEVNNLLYDGEFTVLSVQDDRINRKLWYILNSLNYAVVADGTPRVLQVGDEVIVNNERSSTRYKIIEISNSQSYPRVRFERLEGIEPISVGIGTLKIYSPVVYTKKVRVSIGYNERNVIFLKPINTENHLVAKSWSLGTGFYSNDLRLNSTSTENGLSMEQFYIDYVYDYGEVLQDLVAKKTPNKLAGTPVAPTLNAGNFKVVQINKHLTDTPDANLIKQKHNYQLTLKSEVTQIDQAIIDRNKKVKVTKFKNESDRKKFELEIKNLVDKKDSKSKLLTSVNQEIITLSKSPKNKVEPKYRLRGFWDIPEAIITRGTKPQEIVQFRVQYRYVSKDGRETPVETFGLANTQRRASFSNWNEFKTDARKRNYDSQTGEYFWQIEDVESADTPNINQVDISIQTNERVEFRIKSISEVGWPESPVESDWSETLSIDFPDDLNNVLNENEFILQEASKEDLRVTMQNELSSKGIDEHLADTLIVNNKTFHHESSKILSGFRDENGVALDLFEYMKKLEDRIRGLEEKVRRAKGELQIVILRNNQEFVVSNGSETVFNIECEDYLEPYSGQGVPTGRVYENNVYTIKDFVIRINNIATESPLGLLSNRNYLQNASVYNTNAPQVFWVNNQDELLTSDITGQTRTQLNNQFIWMVNYDSVTENTVAKLSENIGNAFSANSNNSITTALSSAEYNIGYNEVTLLNFVGNNKSLVDPQKWVDRTVTVASTTKLLTTIHPVIKDLENIVENNTDKIKTINPGERNSIIIPLNIYFKMNALDTNQRGANYKFVNLNSLTNSVIHIKKLKFFVENEAENRPFVFTIKFNINRNKVVVKKNSTIART